MLADRETIMVALFAACQKAASFEYTSRVVVNDPAMGPTPQVATPPDQPALILVEDVERHVHTGHGTPTKRTMGVMLMVWVKKPRSPNSPSAPDQSQTGATIVNMLLTSIEAVFAPDNVMQRTFTLGGLVERCWIEGIITKVSGDLDPDGQAFLAVPVSILIP